jgi:hypothetical protein
VSAILRAQHDAQAAHPLQERQKLLFPAGPALEPKEAAGKNATTGQPAQFLLDEPRDMTAVSLLLSKERLDIFLKNAVDKRLFGIARPVRAGGVVFHRPALRMAQHGLRLWTSRTMRCTSAPLQPKAGIGTEGFTVRALQEFR